MFNKDSRICFIGDSITHSGLQIRRIYDYLRNVQKLPLKIFNCGVSGDNATNGLLRLEETVFIHNPTDVVIAYGVNDIGIHLYDREFADDRNINERRMRIDNCVFNICSIADRCIDKGINVIFCTPMTLDELQGDSYSRYAGSMGALLEVSARIRENAKKRSCKVVDYNKESLNINAKLFKKGETIYRDDRVHPTEEGYEFMARVFLNNLGYEINIPNSLEELKTLKELPHDNWENERYDLERKALSDVFVRYCLFANIHDESLIPDLCKKKLETETWDVIINELKTYDEHRAIAPTYREKLYTHTEKPEIN